MRRSAGSRGSSSRRSAGRRATRDADAARSRAPTASRALIAVRADRAEPTRRCARRARRRAFLAHLIATQRRLPQTRERRRAEPQEAIAVYAARLAPAAPSGTDGPRLRSKRARLSSRARSRPCADRSRRSARRAPSRSRSPARRRTAAGATATSWPRAFRPSIVAAGTPRSTSVRLALEEHARRVDRRLHVHAVVDHVGDELRVAHRLIVRAHHAERHFAAPVAHRERRNDGVHRPLAGPIAFGWPGSTTKPEPRLCSMMPVFSVQMPVPNALIERIDQRHRRAVAIDHREIDGVAAGRRRLRQRHALAAIDHGRRGSRAKRLVEQRRRPASRMIGRIGDMRVAHAR